MIEYNIILLILILHFIGDFLFQSNYMATNKSKDSKALSFHIFAYMIPLGIIGFWYAIINGILHFIIDYLTSRITSKLWKEQKIHWFFVTIGFDQTLHFICLFGTYLILK